MNRIKKNGKLIRLIDLPDQRRNIPLHDDADTVLKFGEVGDVDGARGREGDLGRNILDESRGQSSANCVLGLDDSEGGFVGSANADK